jgi:hypothetical protein
VNVRAINKAFSPDVSTRRVGMGRIVNPDMIQISDDRTKLVFQGLGQFLATSLWKSG